MASFIIQQGTDSGISWPVLNATTKQPIDFVGWTGLAQIRSLATNKVLYTFTTDDGTMMLGAGKVTLLWNHHTTSQWTWKTAKFGIELTTPESNVVRFKQGIVTLSKEFVV